MHQDTVFSTLVKRLERGEFRRLVKEHDADRHSKGFGSWQHTLAMVHCHLSGAASLREAEALYNAHPGAHYHLHLPRLKRSTLSQANNRRSALFFRDVSRSLLVQCRPRAEADTLLRVIDSSPIIIKGRNNQWAKATGCARIEGLKLHLSLVPATGRADYVDITHARINDCTAIQSMPLEAGRIYVFDKGYCDYNWWHAIHARGSVFVTRLKRNAACKTLQTHPVAEENSGFVLKDETIVLTNRVPRGGKRNELTGIPLRRITLDRPGTTPLVLVCNDLDKAPQIIAGHYKDRWKVELLFKWLKRYLRVKTFLGETENSIKIQLYTAIIAYCLVWLWRKMQAPLQTITQTFILLQATLFTRQNISPHQQPRRPSSQPQPFQPSLPW